MSSEDPGGIYARLYSRSTAAGLVLLAAVLLAVGQTRTIVDAVQLVHPTWGTAWAWSVAVGFEVAILAVGLVMADTGDKTLWRWELVLVSASVVAGLAVGVSQGDGSTLSLVRAAAVGLMPVQYLAVVLTGQKLAAKGKAAKQKADGDKLVVKGVQVSPLPRLAPEGLQRPEPPELPYPSPYVYVGGEQAPERSRRDPSSPSLAEYLEQRALLKRGLTTEQGDAALAEHFGVSVKTIYRRRKAAEALPSGAGYLAPRELRLDLPTSVGTHQVMAWRDGDGEILKSVRSA